MNASGVESMWNLLDVFKIGGIHEFITTTTTFLTCRLCYKELLVNDTIELGIWMLL
jgi:hypothetical protein